MKRAFGVVLLFVLVSPYAVMAQVVGGEDLYATGWDQADGSSTLYRIRGGVSPRAVPVGEVGAGLTDLAYDPVTGDAFGIDMRDWGAGASHLFFMDLETGATTHIGKTERKLNGLEIGPDGTIYGWGHSPNGVFTIDRQTAQASHVLLLPGGDGGDIAMDPQTGILYAGAAENNPAMLTRLLRIDPSDWSWSEIGTIDGIYSDGLAFGADGTLYLGAGGARSGGALKAELYRVDKNTANATLIGPVQGADGVLGLSGLTRRPARNSLPKTWVDANLYATGWDQADGSSTLYRIRGGVNPRAVPVGETGVGLTDLAYDPVTGDAFGIDMRDWGAGASHLFFMDLETGATAHIGKTERKLNGLEIGPDGTIYGWGHSPNGVFTIDRETAQASHVLLLPGGDGGDIAMDPQTQILYAGAAENNPAMLTRLLRIDPADWSWSEIGIIDGIYSDGLAFGPDGTLYLGAGGARSGGALKAELYRVDKNTANATLIGPVQGADGVLGLSGLTSRRF